jgi:protein-disulfide isomerase
MSVGPRWKESLDVLSTVATVAACAAVIWVALGSGQARSAAPPARPAARALTLPAEPVSLDGAARVGSRAAKVVLIEYSDFQCPYCARAAQETLPPVIDKYVKAGKVQVVFRHLPLSQIHPLAQKAAEAAECAGTQGKFWEMHDVLFRNREKLDVDSLRVHSAEVGLDAARFGRCLDTGEMAAKVRRDAAEAQSMQITGTPTFLLGTLQPGDRVKIVRRATGATPQMLEQALEVMLKEIDSGQ